MVEITMISILFFTADPYCLWKTQFTEQTFSSLPSNWYITGAYSGNRLSDCSGTTIIGGYGIVGSGSQIHGSYSNLPRHSAIKVRLKVYYIDSWDTEVATINVAGFVKQRTWYLDWGWSDMCGAGFNDGYFWETLQGSHTADSFSINLSNGLDDDAYNESLGLKDVEIYLIPAQCIQFFSECNYTGTMKELCQGAPNLDRRNIPQQIKSIRVDGCGQVKLTKKGLGSITITENTPCLTEFDFPPVENLNR
ncbi:unnamed protein product (macronuclear) [Paramecium tetraurelia]|uniref:Uncharacterized protein n=1 Tax=Paramecium tetraurelia TaxID=5888 RepID=A0BK42_PARTE|nr:uncharacterized protein GSPATT00029539001 [Paramecium tetraurelia]CAK58909.1 unnamed protein product [Paramecium tetraurelia]|eukprot:XP_001426307.1 hypothetical protein (macronuclear) [Paramecium tetraurelia strain d4-2]